MFHQAVENKEDAERLEELRALPYYYWEEDEEDWYISPSKALSHAIIHDHTLYARYLLSRFKEEALDVSWLKGYMNPPRSYHLALAVSLDRKDILISIIKVVQSITNADTYVEKLNHSHCRKTPLHLACELGGPDQVLILLASGASPQVKDGMGQTALDVILGQIWTSEDNMESKSQCLEYLLWFSHRLDFGMKPCLQHDPESWAPILGKDIYYYLVGNSAATLSTLAMRRILKTLHPRDYPHNVLKLPLPRCLKPLPRTSRFNELLALQS
ncbi:ankyrin repeat domain-containing protein 9-like [Spea bombifrons]|uniref:ankyrin repeat domain-containing protein 9-like n=1 Tax=Spea bombifrons TaxID=233779 RepID=UPI00234A0CCE|nr:ankyrin repeat domain-containing protein 9-like [Spea bombifrons]